MKWKFRFCLIIVFLPFTFLHAQQYQNVELKKVQKENKINVIIGGVPFTTFFYPDTLEKPVLFPIYSSKGKMVTRGFPLLTKAGEPTDHPHHIGSWFTFENVNGLDFWNNSFAIPADKKSAYGWIRTDKILSMSGGKNGVLEYHANWMNQKKEVLLEETTRFEFNGTEDERIIDRTTTLKANTDVLFKDAKDGLLGFRMAKELQMPSMDEQKFKDSKGNITIVQGAVTNSGGNYLSSEGRWGNDVWSTRGVWCKLFGQIDKDSITIAIIDHPLNPNYPTYWHARGYGLFAANPLGEKIFTNGKQEKNLSLKKGESVTFRYRIIINDAASTLTPQQLNSEAKDFSEHR
jgi:hypothetical protein